MLMFQIVVTLCNFCWWFPSFCQLAQSSFALMLVISCNLLWCCVFHICQLYKVIILCTQTYTHMGLYCNVLYMVVVVVSMWQCEVV